LNDFWALKKKSVVVFEKKFSVRFTVFYRIIAEKKRLLIKESRNQSIHQSISMTSCLLFQVPSEILFRLLPNYLLPSKEHGKSVFTFNLDWKNFLNCDKKHFQSWKKKTIFLSLTRADSLEYVNSEIFKATILQIIEVPRFQLQLTFLDRPHKNEGLEIHSDIAEIANVKKISIQLSHAIKKDLASFLRLINVEECYVSAPSFTDLSFCSTVKNLSIAANAYDSNVDFSPLMNLEELFCQSYSIVNYDHLTYLKKLTLRSVQAVLNASCFAHVPYLKFESCPNLTDVSCLGNVVYLSFNRCPGVSDVSALGKVPTLLFDHCPVSDVSALGRGNHSFALGQVVELTGLSSLRSVYSVNLAGCRLDNIFGLTNVTILDISFSYNISDISFLGESVQGLNMNMCRRITDITMLSSVKVLNVSNCEQIKHFHGLRSLRDLTILGMDFEILSGFETFSQLEKLSIAHVINHEELLPHIQHLTNLKSSGSSFQIHDFPAVQFLFAAQDIVPSKLNLLQCLREVDLYGHSGNVHLVFPFLPFLRKLTLSGFRKMKKLEILGRDSQEERNPSHEQSEDVGEVSNSNKSFPIYHVEVNDQFSLEEIHVSRKIAFMKSVRCDKLVKVVGTGLINGLVTEHPERVTLW
jgi:hypothetical protein